MRVDQLTTDAHIMDVRDLAIAHHEELGGSREFDSAAVVQSGLECRANPERLHFNCWIAYNDRNEAVGYLAATCKQNFYSYRKVAVQEMWYVRKEARGARAAVMLFNAFENWARKLKCEQAYMCVEHNAFDEMTANISRLMNKFGYDTRGVLNIKHFK